MNTTIIFEIDESSYTMMNDTVVILDSFKFANWIHPESYTLLFSTLSLKDSNIAYRSIKDMVLSENSIDIVTLKSNSRIVPIGSIEYVEKFLGKPIKALNVPKELRTEKICKRKIWEGTPETVKTLLNQGYTNLFIKDAAGVKKFEPTIINKFTEKLPKLCFISENIPNIKTEWRVFVYQKEIIDCRMYLGNWRDTLDKDIVQYVVNEYSKSPTAYTLDFALLKSGETVLIEAHNFISCGLYGFEDHNKIKNMVLNAYREEQIS